MKSARQACRIVAICSGLGCAVVGAAVAIGNARSASPAVSRAPIANLQSEIMLPLPDRAAGAR
jgi:hypothetical protein